MQPGVRVEVPLGRGNRKRIGYCAEIANARAAARRLKPIGTVIDGPVAVVPLHAAADAVDVASTISVRWARCSRRWCRRGCGVRRGHGSRFSCGFRPSIAARLTQLKLPEKQAAALRMLAMSPQPMTPADLAQAARCTQAPDHGVAAQEAGGRGSATRPPGHSPTRQPVERQKTSARSISDQQRALDAILLPLRENRHETIVIHGVTGSGKTEVYIRAIDEVIQYGRQAIVLVPEISLTPQTRARFQSRFDRVAVLHSHLTPPERHWHWQQIAAGQVQVVVGARSAVFAPTPNLGLIVIDEEHDASFKQDKAPRYHARDVALQRAAMRTRPGGARVGHAVVGELVRGATGRLSTGGDAASRFASAAARCLDG